MERITLEEGYEDEWVCVCGNTAIDSGFFPCLLDGTEVEPTEADGWVNLYRCAECGRVINQDTLDVVVRSEA